MAPASDARRITTNTLQAMKLEGEKIAMLTAYDYSLAWMSSSLAILPPT